MILLMQHFILHVASIDGKYVSGHNLVVDGVFTSFKNFEFPLTQQVQCNRICAIYIWKSVKIND